MFKRLAIKNFKSIIDLTIELGRVNVFIGANGMGKSNVLEAIAMIAANSQDEIDLNKLVQDGVRIARPDLVRSSFYENKTER